MRAEVLPVPSVTVATEISQALLEHLLVATEREVELPAELCMLQVFAVREGVSQPSRRAWRRPNITIHAHADVLGPERHNTVRVAGEQETVFQRAWSHRQRLLVRLPL